MALQSQLSRIGAIGDVHAEDERLAEALAYLKAQQVDAILCTGDIADGVGDVPRCCRLLSEYGVVTIRGNHDRWLFESSLRDLPDATELELLPADARTFLAALTPTYELTTPLGGLLLCHGLDDDDMNKVGPDDYGYAVQVNDPLQKLMRHPSIRWVINGHSHRPMVRQFASLTIINAGTLRRDHQPGFLLVDFVRRQVEMLAWSESGIRLDQIKQI